MIAALLAFAVGLGQGLVHGLGPDHCAALATLSSVSDGSRRGALRIALRFALGHAALLAALALFCLLLGVGISEAFERWAELLGGTVLLGLALAALFFPATLRHGHPHLPGHDAAHTHPPADRTAHLSPAAGALMAMSGVRSLLLALPPLLVGGAFRDAAWAYLPGFSLGILLSMGAFGLLVAEGLFRFGERLHRVIALSSAAVGLWWIAARL